MKRPATLLLVAILALFASGCEMADREGLDADPGVVPPEPPEEESDQPEPHEEGRVLHPARPVIV